MISTSKSKQLHPMIKISKSVLLVTSVLLMIANLYTLNSTRELARAYTYKQHKATWFLFYLTKEFTELSAIMPHALDSEQDMQNLKLKYELTWSRFDVILNNREADDFREIGKTQEFFEQAFNDYKDMEAMLLGVQDESSLQLFVTQMDALYRSVIYFINDNFKIQSPIYLEQKQQAERVSNIQYILIVLLFISIGLVIFIWHKESQYHRVLALSDPLTDVGNRLSMFQSISQRSEYVPYSLFLLDLNGFKAINDQFGHIAGDSVLKQVSHRLARIPTFDFEVFRMGGDEFAIILNSISQDDLVGMEELIKECFESEFTVNEHQNCSLDTSIGISCYPQDSKDINQLIHIADQNMYSMKHKQKGPSL